MFISITFCFSYTYNKGSQDLLDMIGSSSGSRGVTRLSSIDSDASLSKRQKFDGDYDGDERQVSSGHAITRSKSASSLIA